ncbi:MAG: hypothetical protein H6773_01800 [Pseudomonadales bacterium]|nr:hypothetical protein [Pseudomonadales bacterium]
MKQNDIGVEKKRKVGFLGDSFVVLVKNLSKTEYVWLRHTKHYTGGARGNYGDSTIDIHELAPGGELTLTIDQDEFLLAQNEQGVLFQKI